MKAPFMTYYESMAKLATIANKQTLFLSHILSRMEYDDKLKQLVIELSPRTKRNILESIGAESVNPLNLAKGYLRQLTKAGLIKPVAPNTYTVDPESYGYAKYIPKNLRDRSKRIFEEVSYSTENEVENRKVWVELHTGDIKEITNE